MALRESAIAFAVLLAFMLGGRGFLQVMHLSERSLEVAGGVILVVLGLIPALQSFVKSFAARTGLRVHLTVAAGVERLDGARRTTLYRVAQEALTNAVRHAFPGDRRGADRCANQLHDRQVLR